jgi:hypothetical protein
MDTDGKLRCGASEVLQMTAHGITPSVNVSNIVESFAWFEKLGWRKLWDWGTAPGFGRWGPASAKSFFAKEGMEAAAKART